MRKVRLIKDYKENRKGDIIEVSNNVAFGLIDSGVAKNPEIDNFLVKPKYGKSKAFGSSPSEMTVKRKNKRQK